MSIAWPASWTYVGWPIGTASTKWNDMLKVFLGLRQGIPIATAEIATSAIKVNTGL